MKHRIVLALLVMVSIGGSLAAQEGARWNASLTAGGSLSGGDGMGGLGAEVMRVVGERGAITLAAGYLVTGPIRTDLADDGELNGFWGRLGYAVAF